ncbi:hypothetical protein [Aureimonas sp. AU40]|uniref:hypothetical protein n=1 Tax=Aureimonas sp. AU40 TaxID=1637747 RepID=UPI000783DE4A|nr:hypothetical protein [Aureimonas sp. AU40]
MNRYTRSRAQFGAAVFLSAMRREWVKLHPDRECPVKALDAYDEDSRNALVSACLSVMKASKPESDVAYLGFMSEREEMADGAA